MSEESEDQKLYTLCRELSLTHIKYLYMLEFLSIPEDLNGKKRLLESSLIENMQKFLLELGKGYSFIAPEFVRGRKVRSGL